MLNMSYLLPIVAEHLPAEVILWDEDPYSLSEANHPDYLDQETSVVPMAPEPPIIEFSDHSNLSSFDYPASEAQLLGGRVRADNYLSEQLQVEFTDSEYLPASRTNELEPVIRVRPEPISPLRVEEFEQRLRSITTDPEIYAIADQLPRIRPGSIPPLRGQATQDVRRAIANNQEFTSTSSELAQLPDNQPDEQPPPPNRVRPRPIPVIPLPVLELRADRQEYESSRRVVTASGRVELRYQQAVLNAEQVRVSLDNRLVVAGGDVVLRRGDQTLRGDTFRYLFVQDQGNIDNARGEVFLPRVDSDLTIDNNPTLGLARPPAAPVADQQPLDGVRSVGGFSFLLGGGFNFQNVAAPRTGGTLNRIRFTAERLTFDSSGWIGQNVRLTNDPFSPPELELRADRARVRETRPFVTEITATNGRLVFDQNDGLPIFLDRLVIDRRARGPSLLDFAFDSGDRGGVYVQRNFFVVDQPNFQIRLTPQYFLQKALFGGSGIASASSFGLIAQLNATLSPTTSISGRATFTSLDSREFENRLRGNLQLRQLFGDLAQPHVFTLESTYRDRIFNGSLGFQTVHSSIGAIVTSPPILLGNTGITLSYQGGIQSINSETDDLALLPPIRSNNRVDFIRYQASATAERRFRLWQGERLPPTADGGLRYSPVPILPGLDFRTRVSGLLSNYSNGAHQEALTLRVSLEGQLGNLSRPFLDYTSFNIGYSQTFRSGQSPFLFDRIVDTKVLSAGILQQVYGPVLFGVQTAINLDNNRQISTDYLLEYRRRTYSINLRFNPVLQIGSINLRVNDFNWFGNPDPFDGREIRAVVQGETR